MKGEGGEKLNGGIKNVEWTSECEEERNADDERREERIEEIIAENQNEWVKKGEQKVDGEIKGVQWMSGDENGRNR